MNAHQAPAGVIRGVVTDASGAPAGGARVVLADGPGPLPDIAALTDAQGRFAMTAPLAGTYTVVCRTDADAATLAGTASAHVTVPAPTAGAPATVAVTLRLTPDA